MKNRRKNRVIRSSSSSRIMSERRFAMEPKYGSRASFYNKAHVIEEDDGSITLLSYNTPVARITKSGEAELLPMWDSSQTTLRHVKEFLQQYGYNVGSKSQLAKMYPEVQASSRIGRKRPITAAESYGWVVEDWEAWDAYEFAIDSGYWDEATLNADIVQTLGTDELASSLAYIFRMNDFRQWKGEDEDEDEDYE